MEDLSEWLGVERTTLVRNLRPLVRDGFIKIEGAGRGNRVSVSLTAKGTKELEAVEPAWRSAQDAAVNALGEQRWADLLADLERAVSSLN
jgi:DNA-binding MarR family transcriptional regulator